MASLHPPVDLMLAQSAGEVPLSRASRSWVYEPEFDGWRSLRLVARGVMQSRRGTDLADRFPEIATAADALGDVVLDGVIVALRNGRLDFGALTSTPRTRLTAGISVYYVVTWFYEASG